jgi:hypothetical protein
MIRFRLLLVATVLTPCAMVAANVHPCANLATPATSIGVETNITWKTIYFSPAGPPHYDEPTGTIHRKARVEIDERQAPGRQVTRAFLDFYEDIDRLPPDRYDNNIDVPAVNFHLSDLPFVLKVLERTQYIGISMMCQPGDASGNGGYYAVFEFRDAATGVPIWPH